MLDLCLLNIHNMININKNGGKMKRHVDEYEKLRHENEREIWVKNERERFQRIYKIDEIHCNNYKQMMTKLPFQKSFIGKFFSWLNR